MVCVGPVCLTSCFMLGLPRLTPFLLTQGQVEVVLTTLDGEEEDSRTPSKNRRASSQWMKRKGSTSSDPSVALMALSRKGSYNPSSALRRKASIGFEDRKGSIPSSAGARGLARKASIGTDRAPDLTRKASGDSRVRYVLRSKSSYSNNTDGVYNAERQSRFARRASMPNKPAAQIQEEGGRFQRTYESSVSPKKVRSSGRGVRSGGRSESTRMRSNSEDPDASSWSSYNSRSRRASVGSSGGSAEKWKAMAANRKIAAAAGFTSDLAAKRKVKNMMAGR